jgi:cytochrome b pre-mRNA-processing protein 6
MSRPASVSTSNVCRLKSNVPNLSSQYRIYAQVFSRWPKQDLRPDYQFQDAVRQAVDARFAKYTPAMEADELAKARALQYLEQNRFNDKVRFLG